MVWKVKGTDNSAAARDIAETRTSIMAKRKVGRKADLFMKYTPFEISR